MTTPFSSLLLHRDLVQQLTKREILGRYRGANFGLAWALITPFLMLVIYTFAFGTVMRGRWPGANVETSFSLILFAGLIVHGFFAECITRAPMLVTANPSYVKKIVFPLDLLPWPMVLSAIFHALMNLIVFCVLHLLMDGSFSLLGIALFPIVMFPLVILCLGLAWFLAALGVYFRDIGQVMGLVATAALFLSSAVTPPEIVSPRLRWVIEMNPISFIVNQVRDVLLWGRLPDWSSLALYLSVAAIIATAGWSFFQKTRQGFADVV